MINLFGWFRKKNSNVIPFPKPNKIGGEKRILPSPPEKVPQVYYTIGFTDDNRVLLTVKYPGLLMNKEGCQKLIDKITIFMNGLKDQE
jgi:hypothetical protein